MTTAATDGLWSLLSQVESEKYEDTVSKSLPWAPTTPALTRASSHHFLSLCLPLPDLENFFYTEEKN